MLIKKDRHQSSAESSPAVGLRKGLPIAEMLHRCGKGDPSRPVVRAAFWCIGQLGFAELVATVKRPLYTLALSPHT